MSWIKKRALGLATVLFGMGMTGPAQAKAALPMMTPEQAPRSWIDYADRVNQQVMKWIGGNEPTAVSLRSALDAARPALDKPGASLSLRLWISRRGVISRVENDPIGREGGDGALRALLAGKAIGKPPPRHMLLPLRLRIQLDVAPPVPVPAGGPTAPRVTM